MSQGDAKVASICIKASQALLSDTKRDKIIGPDMRLCAMNADMSMEDHIPHILIVDDNRDIRDGVVRYLEKNGLRVTPARNASEMDDRLRSGRFDLIILDVMMPGEDGLSAARRVSAAGGPPILMLSALAEDTDRIVGLEVGADDYLPKPFNPRELLARIKSILRRSRRAEPLAAGLSGHRLAFDTWVLDTDTRQLTKADDAVATSLTSADFKLLIALLERPRFVLTRDQLLDLTAGKVADVFDRTIDNQISRLRRKIETDPANPKLIITVRAGGYSLACDVRTLP